MQTNLWKVCCWIDIDDRCDQIIITIIYRFLRVLSNFVPLGMWVVVGCLLGINTGCPMLGFRIHSNRGKTKQRVLLFFCRLFFVRIHFFQARSGGTTKLPLCSYIWGLRICSIVPFLYLPTLFCWRGWERIHSLPQSKRITEKANRAVADRNSFEMGLVEVSFNWTFCSIGWTKEDSKQ